MMRSYASPTNAGRACHVSFPFDFAVSNLCRMSNIRPNDEKTGRKVPATIWHVDAIRGRENLSSTRTDGGNDDCIDVDTPSRSDGPPFGLTGSATYLSRDRCALPELRKTNRYGGQHFRTEIFTIKNAGQIPAFLQNTLKEQVYVWLV
ncbi:MULTISPECIES: hypothetical protein [Ensifer]|jgi:hypothetical protein|uniref:Uncharacterized protein n=1 Tax=Ensifer canadensis TaxID=555315 RepID=A0AAW4FT59_9HYPH|nr:MULTISPECIES: hypothetical protein [Ensifer]MDP9630637.1 hypothetical protein [Ensifer adhaerens]MBD9487695.1 hypothetical protein [Ensifer sp. ENS11]MBM3094546.1 hypothetical protein [Ensifer canadensis]NOV18042.1 hypothetical protein [Ensifer canadensis]UBI77043.1 hypothetical protein J3R84_07995 [Ensifer canadensis]